MGLSVCASPEDRHALISLQSWSKSTASESHSRLIVAIFRRFSYSGNPVNPFKKKLQFLFAVSLIIVIVDDEPSQNSAS